MVELLIRWQSAGEIFHGQVCEHLDCTRSIELTYYLYIFLSAHSDLSTGAWQEAKTKHTGTRPLTLWKLGTKGLLGRQ